MDEGSTTPVNSLYKQDRRCENGQFIKGRSGNPAGRPPGARNRATLLAEQLFDGECEALTRKALAMALEGDAVLMRLCLDRILAPRKRRGVAFDLPAINNAGDAAPAMAAIAEAAAQGLLSTAEAAEMAEVVETYMRAIEAGEVERRLARLEAANGLAPADSARIG